MSDHKVMSLGRIDGGGAAKVEIECRRHGVSFDLVSGAPTGLPAVKPVPTYDVEVIEGDIWATLSADSEKVS